MDKEEKKLVKPMCHDADCNDTKHVYNPRICGGCKALESARDYIRILEERAEKQQACIDDFGIKCKHDEEYISFLIGGVKICKMYVEVLEKIIVDMKDTNNG